MKTFPLSKTFHLLEPGPVVLLTTAQRGHANIMTMSWHMMMEFEPPLIGCIVSSCNFSFRALRATRECVIAIPTVDLASTVVDIGNCSGEDVDKFEAFNLTPLAAEQVQAPLIAECLANIECKVIDTSLVNKYNLFILEGVKAWSDAKRKERRTIHANGDGTFVTDGKTIDLKKKMVKWKALL
ncbi:MAG: flavin reductase family protein [Candidatus Korobacteraceae bacterium]|jgi:flavin reductase (DIM6/NTAB) family NADH-FMN oxidoreductase RutF